MPDNSPIYKIGTTLYVVNKALKVSAKVLPAKVKGYQNIDGIVYPILKLVGGQEISPEHNHLFDDLNAAVAHITTNK